MELDILVAAFRKPLLIPLSSPISLSLADVPRARIAAVTLVGGRVVSASYLMGGFWNSSQTGLKPVAQYVAERLGLTRSHGDFICLTSSLVFDSESIANDRNAVIMWAPSLSGVTSGGLFIDTTTLLPNGSDLASFLSAQEQIAIAAPLPEGALFSSDDLLVSRFDLKVDTITQGSLYKLRLYREANPAEFSDSEEVDLETLRFTQVTHAVTVLEDYMARVETVGGATTDAVLTGVRLNVTAVAAFSPPNGLPFADSASRPTSNEELSDYLLAEVEEPI